MMAPNAAIVRSYTLALWPSGPAQHGTCLAYTTAAALLANAAFLSQTTLVSDEHHSFDEGHFVFHHCAAPGIITEDVEYSSTAVCHDCCGNGGNTAEYCAR